MAEQMINNHPEEAADLNELLRIRRDKLTELQNAGAYSAACRAYDVQAYYG